MNVPIKSKNDVAIPPSGYVFAFIDSNDMQLKAKLSNGTVVNYTRIDEDVKVMSLTDYTAFEVMPNKVTINPETVDKDTGLTYSISVPACTEHKFTLRSVQEPEDCDVVIDWGDGTVESIKDGKFVGHEEGKSYELSHDYSSKMTENIQKFIVKVYGKNYYTMRTNNYKQNNLISRIFDVDLPLASHIGNLASFAIYANRLLKVKFPHSTAPYSNVWNWSYTFGNCSNLLEVVGFEDISVRDDAITIGMMQYCTSLINTDFVFPAKTNSLRDIYQGCKNFAMDINKLIPANGFTSNNIFISRLFIGSKVSGTIPAEKLWNDKSIKWIFDVKDREPFLKCTDETRVQVPVSWGGTADDSIIEPSLEERIKALEEAMSNTLALDK